MIRGGFVLASNNNSIMLNSLANDLVIYTGNSNQNILFGSSNNNQFLKLASNSDVFIPNGSMYIHSNLSFGDDGQHITFYPFESMLGLNVKTPTKLLDINGTLGVNGNLSIGTNTLFPLGSFMGLNTSHPTTTLDINGNLKLQDSLMIESSGSPIILFSKNGNLGLNEGNPKASFDVAGTIKCINLEYCNISGGTGRNVGNWSEWYENNNGDIFFTGYNVGINQPIPAYKLDVNGPANITRDLYVGGNLSNIGRASFSNIDFTGALTQNGSIFKGNQWSTSNNTVYIISSNIGINQSQPQYTLDVNGTVNITSNFFIGGNASFNNIDFIGSFTKNGLPVNFSGTSNSSNNILDIVQEKTVTDLGSNISVTNSSNGFVVMTWNSLDFYSHQTGSSTLIGGSLWTSYNNNVVYIMPPYNIGIGTTTPLAPLHVASNMRVDGIIQCPSIEFIHDNNASPYNYSSSSSTFSINSSSNSFIFDLLVGTTNTELMRMAGTGKLGIGISNPTFLLHLGSDSAAKPSSSLWTVSSDERLKEDIKPANLDLCYNNIKNAPLKRYTWKDKNVHDKSRLGWIAQDIEGIFPKSVSRNALHEIEDCMTLDADQLYTSLFGAVQKLQIMVEQILDRIDLLETKIQM